MGGRDGDGAGARARACVAVRKELAGTVAWLVGKPVMEALSRLLFKPQGTLAHAIDQHRFMTVTPLGSRRPALKAICTTLLEVALALRHLHARNLAHCDLKPANVLLKSSRRDSRGFTCKVRVGGVEASPPGLFPPFSVRDSRGREGSRGRRTLLRRSGALGVLWCTTWCCRPVHAAVPLAPVFHSWRTSGTCRCSRRRCRAAGPPFCRRRRAAR